MPGQGMTRRQSSSDRASDIVMERPPQKGGLFPQKGGDAGGFVAASGRAFAAPQRALASGRRRAQFGP